MNSNEKVINLCKFIKEYINLMQNEVARYASLEQLERRYIIEKEIELLLEDLNPQQVIKEDEKQLKLF
jgi:hypothetical protein